MPIDGSILSRVIRATFRRRRTPLPKEVPTGLSSAFSSEPLKRAQWRAFVRRIPEESVPESLEQVLQRLREFHMPLIAASLAGRSFAQRWLPGGPWRSK